VSPLELVDDRFEKLAAELRASRPVASPALHERVEALARREPPPRRDWSLRLPSRRVALAFAALLLLGSFVAAAVTGLGGSNERDAFKPVVIQHGEPATQRRVETPPAFRAAEGQPLRASPQASLAPTPGRLQRFDAQLRLRVKHVEALSAATSHAISLTRSLGGYVGSVQYATRGGKRGGATLLLRVPVANLQAALADLSRLGTILQQHTAILDVTQRADTEAKQIAKLERALVKASAEEAPLIRLKLKTLRAKHARLLRSARLARITLALTTPAKQTAAPASRFDRTLDDAGAVLLRELEILLYALVVAGPLLLLGGLGVAAARTARRRADARLLERT
jgi:Domain of unknown function (DUF4349)